MTEQPIPQRRSRGTDSATREQLLVAAREAVAADGLNASSRRITTTAGVNLAAITYYFGSKDQLIAAALLEEIETLVEPALVALEQAGDPVGRLATAVATLLATFEAHRERVPVLLEALLLASGDRPGAESARNVINRLRARLAAVVTELQATGAIPTWVEPDAMASLIVAVSSGIAVQSRVEPAGPTTGAVAAQFASLLVASTGAAAQRPME